MLMLFFKRNFFCVLLIGGTLNSFAQKTKNVNVKPVPLQTNYAKPCDCSSLVKKNELYYSAKTDSLYTGKCADYWPNNNVKVLYTYKNGKLDGGLTRYDENGRVTATEGYKDGKPFGVWHKF